MQETIYAIALQLLSGLQQQAKRKCLETYGSATELRDHLPELTKSSIVSAIDWSVAEARAEREWIWCQQHGVRVLSLLDEDYPHLLRESCDPPIVLFCAGRTGFNPRHSLSVVGTRKMSDYGRRICQDFIYELSLLVPDCLVVSGLAYGVDITAHMSCVEHGLPTVAVLGHGQDRIYPEAHRRYANQIVESGGAIITEFPTGTEPRGDNFTQRDRIIAGMTQATVVIESPERGGSLATARFSRDYNRETFAFPGDVCRETSVGCNHLIRGNMAILALSARSVAEELGWVKAARP